MSLAGDTAMTDLQNLQRLVSLLSDFAFAYPLVMAYVWMTGATIFHLRSERGRPADVAPDLARHPAVSILVPCFNEERNVREVIEALMRLDYPNYEIIAINDGSHDATGGMLEALARAEPRLRVIHQSANQGKAVGLDTGTLVARGEIVLGIDGDAVLDPQALQWLVRHFIDDPRVGAVTGNPRIRTRTTLLGKLQVAEFSSMVGLIKRAQQVLTGRLFTLSGVIACFRRQALDEIGYWSHDMLTEDIDVSWKLQARGWRLHFEPNALVWILMPETLRGLWKQRLRWATGGVQVIAKFCWILRDPRQWRMWPVYLEYLASLVWAHAMAALMLLAVAGHVAPAPAGLHVPLLPGWGGLVMAVTCLMQFALSLWMDARYDVHLHRYLWSAIWYPVAFWMICMATAVVALPRFLVRARGQRAIWTSPDRGAQQRPRLMS